jgi:hypothetical protein
MTAEKCDAELYEGYDEYYGTCGEPATHDVLCSDGRWHSRCESHVLQPFSGARVRERAPRDSSGACEVTR